jgi:hypothetical protein
LRSGNLVINAVFDKTRVIDISEEISLPEGQSARIKKLGAEAPVRAGETCFVMQPFAAPYGNYYEKIFKPAIEKTGLHRCEGRCRNFCNRQNAANDGSLF